MNLAEAKALGLKHKARKRIGRGTGSGHGKTSGRGHKGARARSGWSQRVGHEGGQMPLFRRVPKRGFNNPFRKVHTIINVADLAHFQNGDTVDLQAVLAKGLVSQEKHSELFKILGNGEVSVKVNVRVDAISATARQKIEAAGGTVELIPQKTYRAKNEKKDSSGKTPRKVKRAIGRPSDSQGSEQG